MKTRTTKPPRKEHTMPINPEDIEFEDAAVRYLNLEGREGMYK